MSLAPLLVGVGEILWDLFPDGPRFGGAPANFACHAAALGARAAMVGAVGSDPLGEQALAELAARGVDVACVLRLPFPTGTVNVEVDAEGGARYFFAADAAWDHLVWNSALADLAARADAVCFGSLGQRGGESQATIQRFVAAAREACLRIFDVNLRPPHFEPGLVRESLRLANVVKLNEDELPRVAAMVGLHGPPAEILAALGAKYGYAAIALTRGNRGSLLWRPGELHEHPGAATEVRDTVGAGDAFTAALALGLARGEPLPTIHDKANRLAAFVCSQPGATPPLPAELRGMFA